MSGLQLGAYSMSEFDTMIQRRRSAYKEPTGMKSPELPSRRVSQSNCLGKDDDLWFPNGDCLVFLYKENQSQRGPAFRLPYEIIRKSGFPGLLRICHKLETSSTSTESTYVSSDIQYQIYMPPPAASHAGKTFSYHSTTRNIFRFLLGQPLVASNLGPALVALTERINHYGCPEYRSLRLVLEYMNVHGYLNFAHNPTNALAGLLMAERFQQARLWADAFAHCVGMGQQTLHCDEYCHHSAQVQNLICQAQIELAVQTDSASRLLYDFDTLPLSIHTNLSTFQHSHLERFAGFLRGFCAAQFGTESCTPGKFDRGRYLEMRAEFENLYEYLSDSRAHSQKQSRLSEQEARLASSLLSFDAQKGYLPLSNTLPILPNDANKRPQQIRRHSQMLNSLATMLPSITKQTTRMPNSAEIKEFMAANNSNKPSSYFVPMSLTSRFALFELESFCNDSTLTASERRVLDWTVVYSILQTLTWITSSVSQVRDSDVAYPLCCMLPNMSHLSGKQSTMRPMSQLGVSEISVSPAPTETSSIWSPISDSSSNSAGEQLCSRSNSISTTCTIPSRASSLRFPRRYIPHHRKTHSDERLRAPSNTAQSSITRSNNRTNTRSQRASYQEIIIPSYGNGMLYAAPAEVPLPPSPGPSYVMHPPPVCYSPSIYSCISGIGNGGNISPVPTAILRRHRRTSSTSSSNSDYTTTQSEDSEISASTATSPSTTPSLHSAQCESEYSVTATETAGEEMQRGAEQLSSSCQVELQHPRCARPRWSLGKDMEVKALGIWGDEQQEEAEF